MTSILSTNLQFGFTTHVKIAGKTQMCTFSEYSGRDSISFFASKKENRLEILVRHFYRGVQVHFSACRVPDERPHDRHSRSSLYTVQLYGVQYAQCIAVNKAMKVPVPDSTNIGYTASEPQIRQATHMGPCLDVR